jgi:hypothetical protein
MKRYPRVGQGYSWPPPRRGSWLPRWMVLAVLIVVAGIVFSRPAKSQLQQSGGTSSVTVTGSLPAGSAVIGKVGIDQTTPGTTNLVSIGSNGSVTLLAGGSTVIGHVIADSGSTTAVTSLPSLVAGSALIGYTRPQNGCGTTNYEAGLQNLPNSSTSLTATTTCVLLVSFTNTTAGAVTVTMQDQTTNCNSGACQVLNAFSIPANSNLLLPLYGTKFTSGIKWNASAANSITGNVIGNQ